MPGVQAFLTSPLTFMEGAVVRQAVGGKAVNADTAWFTFQQTTLTGQLLSGAACPVYDMVQATSSTPTGDKFEAYWCKYAADEVNAITLAAAADYMFTAAMDGCSFGVGIPATNQSVRVAHANQTTSQAQDKLGQLIIDQSLQGNQAAAAQLNMEQLKTKGQEQQTLLIGAQGLNAAPGMVLGPLDYKGVGLKSTTFGVRGPTGKWSFYFHAYRKVPSGYELIGCFPFPGQV